MGSGTDVAMEELVLAYERLEMAVDQVEAMAGLGFDRFAVAEKPDVDPLRVVPPARQVAIIQS